MKSPLLIILASLTIGLAVGFLLKDGSSKHEPIQTSITQNTSVLDNTETKAVQITDNHAVRQLQQQLQDEITARQSLQKQLDSLGKQLAALEQNWQLQYSEQSSQPTSTSSHPESTEKDWFNTQALIDGGLSSAEANDLKVFFEQQEMQLMFLRDQSIRESWDRQKYREELQKVEESSQAFLNQLNDSTYDAYLYASGQPNRVEVTNVLDSSQASSAGIQPGDRIISYDNERIYSGFELRTATSGGDINASVAVEVERDGEILELYLSRGPLGIRMNSISVAPDH